MSLTIPIETSARHIHLSQEDFKTLFGPDAELTYVKELSQPGQYACQERLTVVGPKGSFENVIVLGPCRSKTQVEVSVTDNRKLGIPSVIRQSGDISNTPGCTLIGPCGTVDLTEGVIVAKRHIHMTPRQMKRRVEFKQDIRRNSRVTKHKCAICGQTEDDDPTLEFRFCSKCNGNYEYCQQHLFTHTHVKHK